MMNEIKKKSFVGSFLAGIALVGIIIFIFVNPKLRHWVSKEGETLQVVEALTGILIIISSYIIHPLWMIIKPNENGEKVVGIINKLVDWLRNRRHTIALSAFLVSLVWWIQLLIATECSKNTSKGVLK